jgi:O-antigen/teichoic acid export membrane protein
VNRFELRHALSALGRESWLLFLALTVVNASNYVFHVAVSRVLGPDEYGALGSVLAVLTVMAVPLTAVQATVARRIASSTNDAESHQEWRTLLSTALWPTLGVTVGLAALSPLLSNVLHLNSFVTGLWVSAYIVPAVLSSILRGAFQGSMRFLQLALVSLLPVLLRLGMGLAAVNAGFGVTGAVAASVLSDLVGVAIALWLIGYWRTPVAGHIFRIGSFLREVVPVALGLGAMWVLIEIDLVLARHYLPGPAGGEYAAAGLLARAVLFVPGAVSLIALPHFSRHAGRGNDAYRWLVSSCAVVLLCGVFTAIILFFTGDFVVALTFGSGFDDAAELLPVLSMAMLGFGIVNLLVNFHIAAGSRTYNLLWLAALAQAAMVAVLNKSGSYIALATFGMAWSAAIGGFLLTRSMALSIPGMQRLPSDLHVYSMRTNGTAPPEVTLVVPSHNAGENLGSTVAAAVEALGRLDKSYEVIVVSDGSTDGSDRAVASQYDNVSVIHYARRQGKGIALRVGMARARGRFVAFMDADGDLDVAEFKSFFALMDLYDPDLVIGSKRHPLSSVSYPLSRRIMSWIYHRMVRSLFGLRVSDTQTGMKLIRRDVLDAVLPRMLEKRFAFDLEFLVVARRLGFRRIFEAPIRLHYKFGSTVSVRSAAMILIDTASIYYRRYILRYYDQTDPELSREAMAPSISQEADISTEARLTS